MWRSCLVKSLSVHLAELNGQRHTRSFEAFEHPREGIIIHSLPAKAAANLLIPCGYSRIYHEVSLPIGYS